MQRFRSLLLLTTVIMSSQAYSQTVNVVTGNTVYHFSASQAGDMNYADGKTLTIEGKVFSIDSISRIFIDDSNFDDNTVTVTYNGNKAEVDVAGNIAAMVSPVVSGAHISIVQSDNVADEITYRLSGSSTDGEFYMSGSYKATIEFNGLTLTNTTPVYSGAAVNIQDGKRIDLKVINGTVNTLADASSGSQKACLYVKEHTEFKQKGTLNVTGNAKHAIKSGEYLTIKNSNVNILSAVADGLNCAEYFQMESGSLSISGTEDDEIQCDLDGKTSTGETTNHDNEDSGNIYNRWNYNCQLQYGRCKGHKGSREHRCL